MVFILWARYFLVQDYIVYWFRGFLKSYSSLLYEFDSYTLSVRKCKWLQAVDKSNGILTPPGSTERIDVPGVTLDYLIKQIL